MGVQIGDIKTFRATLTKNSLAWGSPALASASFLFYRPDGTTFTLVGTVNNPTTASAQATTTVVTLDADGVVIDGSINLAGAWAVYVETTDASGNVLTSPEPHTFNVFGFQEE